MNAPNPKDNLVSFQEFRERIPILQLALSLGYTVNREKTCARYPVLDHPTRKERIYIINPTFPGNQGYVNVDDDCDKGTLVDFVKKRLHTDFTSFFDPSQSVFHCINKVLYHHLHLELPRYEEALKKSGAASKSNPAGEEQFRLELFDLQPFNHRNFLHKRGLSDATLDDPRFTGKIFNLKGQSDLREFYNTCFPYYKVLNGPICGLELKNYNFGGHAENSEKSTSVWVSNVPEPVSQAFIMESGLDALSHYELHRPQNALYFSTGGNLTSGQVETIERIFQDLAGTRLQTHLCFDNDPDGAFFALKYLVEAGLPEVPPGTAVTKSKDFITLMVPEGRRDQWSGGDTLHQQLTAFMTEANKRHSHHITQAEGDAYLKNEIARLFYRMEPDRGGGALEIKIPRTFSHLHTFTGAFIHTLGLGNEIVLNGALLKDFNEDLQKAKGLEVKSYSSHHKATHDSGNHQPPLPTAEKKEHDSHHRILPRENEPAPDFPAVTVPSQKPGFKR